MRVVKIHTKDISNEDLREIQDQIDEILSMDIYNMGPSGPKKNFSSKKREREPENIKKGETENIKKSETENIQEQIEKIKDELSGVKENMSLKENQNQIIKPKTMKRRDTDLRLREMIQERDRKKAEEREALTENWKNAIKRMSMNKNVDIEKYKSQIDKCNEELKVCKSKNEELTREMNDFNGLGDKLKECTDELALLKNENAGIKNDISQLQSDKSSCEANIKQLEEAKSLYEAKIKEMDNLNLKLKDKLTQLENKNVEEMYKNQIGQLGNDKKEYEKKINDFNKVNLGLKAKLSQYENSLNKVTKERDEIKKNIDSLTITANTYRQQINDANKKIEEYKNSILFNQKQNEKLQKLMDEKIGENNEKINQLTQQIAADKEEIAKINKLTQQIAADKKDIEELNKELDRYESETRQLDSMVKDLQQKNKEITENNTKYVNEIESFQKQIEQLTNQNAELLRQKSDNGDLYNKYKDEVEQKISGLNETNQQLGTKLNDIELQRKNLLEKYEDLKKKK